MNTDRLGIRTSSYQWKGGMVKRCQEKRTIEVAAFPLQNMSSPPHQARVDLG
jgi:hypothetical protein